ncbi:fumarylacetoacetate hydrolase family protein [Actinopolymorpha sp. B17G11]|uniref:fumarylacetoacetate hydrolase family protein n=1 Tax=Actinopolymorpha sp. B17G11 TaxID=3160861 RepID=UPI0032E43C1D
MRLAVLPTADGPRLALGLPDDWLVRLDRVVPDAPTDTFALLDLPDRDKLAGRAREALERPALREALRAAGELRHVDDGPLAVPLTRTGKVICLALNYQAHAQEGGFTPPERPVIFLKGPNSLCGHGQEVVVPPVSRRIDHEGELAVVVGRRSRGLTAESWRGAVAGYTIMNDLTARDLQLADIAQQHPWDFTKSFDSYGPTGPFLLTPDEVPDPQSLEVSVRVDGEVRQHGSTSAMIFGVADLLCYISAVMTLEPGDVIATGTPDGIGPLRDGATAEVTIGPLGTLRNRIRFET